MAVDPNLFSLLPSDLDGPPPPPGSPNYFVAWRDDWWGYLIDALEVWDFYVDWTNPLNSIFTGPTILSTAPFDSDMCGYAPNCIPQPGGTPVDALSAMVMHRL